MKPKLISQKGNRWCFVIEAKVRVMHYHRADPDLMRPKTWRNVLAEVQEQAEEIVKKQLIDSDVLLLSGIQVQLSWDKGDLESVGTIDGEPDPRDGFPGFCPHPDCVNRNVQGSIGCEDHLVEGENFGRCPGCRGWITPESLESREGYCVWCGARVNPKDIMPADPKDLMPNDQERDYRK